jgi:hypothetical protein
MCRLLRQRTAVAVLAQCRLRMQQLSTNRTPGCQRAAVPAGPALQPDAASAPAASACDHTSSTPQGQRHAFSPHASEIRCYCSLAHILLSRSLKSVTYCADCTPARQVTARRRGCPRAAGCRCQQASTHRYAAAARSLPEGCQTQAPPARPHWQCSARGAQCVAAMAPRLDRPALTEISCLMHS